MDSLEKVSLFEKELNLIQNKEIKSFTVNMLTVLPDYFFTIPASSTGKYHPKYALGEGGLVRHVKAAVGIAEMLFEISNFTVEQKDVIISALILHDGCKNGKVGSVGDYTVFRHPLEMVELIKENYKENKPFINSVCICIASHMGKWNKDYKSSATLPLPETRTESFVHWCDYLASRKKLEYNFDIN